MKSKINYESVLSALARVKLRDKERVPLRLDSHTVILVKPENCNEEYRIKYNERIRHSQGL